MKTNEIEKLLGAMAPFSGQNVRPACDFWQQFRARASDATPRDARIPASMPFPRRMAWFAGPMVAAAAAVLVAVFWTGSGPVAVPDSVRSYRVGDDVVHGGVMILNDEPSQATILWIADVAENA